MANIRAPEYGVIKDELTLTSQDPAAVVYGVTPSNHFIPLRCSELGELLIGATIEVGELVIGAVELKSYDSDIRAFVSSNHELLTTARLYDAAGTALTSTNGNLNSSVFGFDGTNSQPLKTDTAGQLQVNVINSTLSVSQSGTWSVGRTWTLTNGTDSIAAVQSGTWNINNISGTISLPTGASTEATLSSLNAKFVTGTIIGDVNAAQKGTWNITNVSGTVSLPTGASTEATLAAIKTDTDKFVFSATRLLVDGSGVTQPVSGTVAISNATLAVTQSGTWNINNISGTVSLPTGASTEATLAGIKTDTDKLTFAATRLLVDGSGVTQPISASALPLPTGASTSANQTSGSQKSQIVDGSGNVIGATSNALDVNIKSGVTLSVSLDHTTDNVLVYGNDGTTDRKLLTNAAGNLQVGITNATLAVTQSGAWTTGRTWTLASGTDSISSVQSGTWNLTNISGTISLPTGAATSAKQPALGTAGTASSDVITIQGIAGMTAVKVDGSGVTQPVSGTVTVGNATLAVTQSGTWNINNISGTISLPTGAATETTLAAIKTDTDKFTFASTRLLVDGSGVTQPVSGTVAVSNFPAKQSVAISQSGTDNNVDVIDRQARELGRVLASDQIYVAETFTTTSNVLAQARPTNGDFNVAHFKTKKIFISNTSASNAGRVDVSGSIDGGTTFDIPIATNVALTAGNSNITDITDAVTHIRVQARSQTNGQTTTFSSKAYALGV